MSRRRRGGAPSKPEPTYPRLPLVRTLRHLLRDPERSLLAKALGALIVDHADEKGECFPSQRELADYLGVTVRSVRRGLTELRDSGHIEIKGRRRQDGRGRTSDLIVWQTNLFPLLVLKGVENSTFKRTPVSGWSDDQADKRDRPSGHLCPGDTMKYPTEVPCASAGGAADVDTAAPALGPGSDWQRVKDQLRGRTAGGAA